MSRTPLRIKIIAAQLENGTGRGIGTGGMKDVTGTKIISEMAIMAWNMGGDGKETEAVRKIERGRVIETVTTASQKMTIIVDVIGIEVQGEKGTMKTKSTIEDVPAVVAPALDGVPRMMAQGRSPRKERKTKKRRVTRMRQILMIQRL